MALTMRSQGKGLRTLIEEAFDPHAVFQAEARASFGNAATMYDITPRSHCVQLSLGEEPLTCNVTVANAWIALEPGTFAVSLEPIMQCCTAYLSQPHEYVLLRLSRRVLKPPRPSTL